MKTKNILKGLLTSLAILFSSNALAVNLLYSTYNGNPELYSFDTETGISTFVADINDEQIDIQGMTVHPSSAVLYAISREGTLYTIDYSSNPAQYQFIGKTDINPGQQSRGLSFNPITGALYALEAFGKIFKISPSDGSTISQVSIPDNTDVRAFAFNYQRELYVRGRFNHLLYKLDPETGQLELVGNGTTTPPTPFGATFDDNGRLYGMVLNNSLSHIYETNLVDGGYTVPGGTITIGNSRAVTFVPTNNPPIANPGSSETVHVGDTVILDADGSSDPDGNHPLTYAWQFTSIPAGSSAVLSDATAINPDFVADLLGDYTLELVVTDSLGRPGLLSEVTISTSNTPPVADADSDQVINLAGTVVLLDGSQSYDADGDSLTALWSFTSVPAGSNAVLSDNTSLTPRFIADVPSDYVLSLTVTDIYGASSTPDSVTITFNNAKPVADAGLNRVGLVGDTILLDGSASSDANHNILSYHWSFTAIPAGSNAIINDATLANPEFTANVKGSYIVSLVVNDGFIDSDPSTAITEIVDSEPTVIELIEQAIGKINAISPNKTNFKNKKANRKLTKTINKAIREIDRGRNDVAKTQLNKVLRRTDGCASSGAPDKTDWIKQCSDQNAVYPLISNVINML